MSNGAVGAGAAGGAAATMIAQAIKASGAIVRVEPRDFENILQRGEKLLVVAARGGFFTGGYHYLTAYKGLIFYCKSPDPLMLPGDVETIEAKKIWIPA